MILVVRWFVTLKEGCDISRGHSVCANAERFGTFEEVLQNCPPSPLF